MAMFSCEPAAAVALVLNVERVHACIYGRFSYSAVAFVASVEGDACPHLQYCLGEQRLAACVYR